MECGLHGTKAYYVNSAHMGINGKALAYIEQFVTNRTMQVRVGSELSVTHYLENGTPPQGSIISPLLFFD